jgi:anaerobic selenocysteine-containing dehydrogenase
MFGGELSPASQAIIAQLPYSLRGEGRRVLLHPLPLFNNSVGAYDMSRDHAKDIGNVLSDEAVRALIVAGDPMLPNVGGDSGNAIPNRDFVVLWELFISEVSEFARQADVILPAASFAEVDGTFTNNDGLVQRVRKSIEPVHQSLPDWMIAARLAKELGVDFGFERSASAVFREISERVTGYEGIRYPNLKDESKPVQVKHAIAPQRDLSSEVETLRRSVDAMSGTQTKTAETPSVGHELFKPGTLISKTPQIGLLDAGNPKPDSVLVSPLYQITVDEKVKREPAVA